MNIPGVTRTSVVLTRHVVLSGGMTIHREVLRGPPQEFYFSSRTDKITPLDFTPVILGLVLREWGLACICIRPKRVDSFMLRQRLMQSRGLSLHFCVV